MSLLIAEYSGGMLGKHELRGGRGCTSPAEETLRIISPVRAKMLAGEVPLSAIIRLLQRNSTNHRPRVDAGSNLDYLKRRRWLRSLGSSAWSEL